MCYINTRIFTCKYLLHIEICHILTQPMTLLHKRRMKRCLYEFDIKHEAFRTLCLLYADIGNGIAVLYWNQFIRTIF